MRPMRLSVTTPALRALRRLSIVALCALFAVACVDQEKSGAGTGANKKAKNKGVASLTPKTKVAPKSTDQESKARTPPRPPRPTKLRQRPVKPPEFAGAHILIGYKGARRSKATRTKAQALALATKLTAQAKKNPKKFAELARKNSEGPSAKKGGSLGTWRKGRMVPAFDTAIAALATGAISDKPVETPFGYHVMRRLALAPLISGAHILIAFKGARRARPTIKRSKEEAKKIAAKLVAELKRDPKKFAELVEKHSDGPGAKRGGKLGTWRQGSSHPAFDKALAPLSPGQVAGPVATPFGYHVFLRTPTPKQLAGAHILIAYKGARRARGYITRSKEEAKKLATELAGKTGKDPSTFPQLALKHSDGPSAQYGGDLGQWRQGMMAPAFDKAILGLTVGQVTAQPVETPFGFHVIMRKAVDKPGVKAKPVETKPAKAAAAPKPAVAAKPAKAAAAKPAKAAAK